MATKKNESVDIPETTEQTITAATDDVEEVRSTRTGRSRISVQSAAKRSLSPAEQREKMDRRDTQLEAIRSAIYNKTILKNTVVGVQPITIKDTTIMCLAFPLPEGIKVIIPYNKVFQNPPINPDSVDESTEEGLADYHIRQRQVLDSMVGAETRWLPENIISDENTDQIIVVGSRTAAMEIDRETYYFRENANIKNNSTYRGRVVFVNPHSAMVLLGGVEKIIPQATITNRYAADLREIFSPGDRIPIAVKDLRVDKAGKRISVKFDCLTGELIEAQENISNISPNELTFATISKSIPYKDESGASRVRLYAWIDGWNVPAKITGVPYNRFGIPLKMGDKVRVKITGVDEEGYVTCFIRSTHNTSGL